MVTSCNLPALRAPFDRSFGEASYNRVTQRLCCKLRNFLVKIHATSELHFTTALRFERSEKQFNAAS